MGEKRESKRQKMRATDFELWKAKIKAVLGQLKALLAITDPAKYPETLSEADKETIETVDQPTAYALWNKLNEIYLNKDLPNKAFLRERFFTYKMHAAKSLTDNLNELKRLSYEFRSIRDNIGEENEAFILLNSLLESFKDVKTAMKYGRERITTEAIISAVKVRELELQMSKKDQQGGDCLFSKGKNKNNGKGKQNNGDSPR
ncbi:uncharacterized protein LOC120067620 [Benincasa hispida]|uniref:uncharacterized protein LOC120067620 n=1 Tax=Benincasa hispida TaxID=102211 RepID=UPI001901AAF1|nr:uncharacterized protein LOC120067620 [Benincasa hispida]